MLQFTKWKVVAILAVIAFGFVMALPSVLPKAVRDAIPPFLPRTPVVLGLDLQGGSHVLLEVDRTELVDQLSKQLIGDIRQTLREKRIRRYSGLGRTDGGVSVRITEEADVERAYDELKALSKPITIGFFGQGGQAQEYTVTRDGNVIHFAFTDEGLDSRIGRAVEQSLEIIGQRINALGTTEPSIQRQGNERILVQVPGLQDPEQVKRILGQTARLQFRLLCDSQPTAEGQRPPAECEELPEQKAPERKYWVQTSSLATVEGEDLNDAQPGFDSRTNEPVVNFRFNQNGAVRFGRLTQANVGRPFAIVLDNEVVSAPRINEPILGGSGQISGRFTVEEARDLAIVLRSGALPAKLTIVEERTVGPSLGSDSVRAGLIACIVGLAGVFVFMAVSYGLFGLMANLALVANLVLLMGILSALQATLTLPGIAGIVLTMGMAVDSNVLVFERIREEVMNGRSPLSAIETGFRMALATVLDANITTLIAAVVLFGMGSGPIRGFAVTLAIGIVTTVFTAYTFTRLMIVWWIWITRPKAVPL
jgi:protein-export membrane protein SecD